MALFLDQSRLKIKASEAKGKKKYTVNIPVRSDDNDCLELRPKQIFDLLDASGFTDASTYDLDNGVDEHDPTAVLVSRSIGDYAVTDNTEGKRWYRLVRLEYEQSSATIEGLSGKPPWESSDLAWQWEPRIFIREIPRLVPAQKLYFLGAHNRATSDCDPATARSDLTLVPVANGSCQMTIGGCYPVQSTAGEPYANPPMLTEYDEEITIVENLEDIQGNRKKRRFRGTINNTQLRINLPLQKYDEEFDPWELRYVTSRPSITSRTYQTASGEITDVFWQFRHIFISRPGGWDFSVLNVGTKRAAVAGDRDNGVLVDPDIATHSARRQPIRDPHRDTIITDPVKLFVDGSELEDGTEDVYTRWGYQDRDFLHADMSIPGFEAIGGP